MEFAFYGAENLEKIVIPASVMEISSLEFADVNLEYAVVLPETPPKIIWGYYNPFDKIYDSTHKVKTYKIYVPDNSYMDYAEAYLWKEYYVVGRLAKLSQFNIDFPDETYLE